MIMKVAKDLEIFLKKNKNRNKERPSGLSDRWSRAMTIPELL